MWEMPLDDMSSPRRPVFTTTNEAIAGLVLSWRITTSSPLARRRHTGSAAPANAQAAARQASNSGNLNFRVFMRSTSGWLR